MLADDRHVGSVERVLHLKKAPIVGTLPPPLLSALADATRPRVFRKGQLLLREGERIGANYFVVEGRLLLQREGRLLDHGEPGAAIGVLGILAHAPSPVTASAEVDTLTLELDADTCFELLEDHFGMLRHFLREVTARIIEGWRRLPPGSPPVPPGIVPKAVPASSRDLDLVDRIFYLRQVVPFERSSINALAELARALQEVHFAPGSRLWSEGEAARHVVLVVAGHVECSARDGFELPAGPGTPLGALEAIAGLPRWYTADVTVPLTGLSAEIEVLFDVLEDNHDMALSQLTTMSQWALALTQQLAERAALPLGAPG
jgi:CRP-like cAMP-binding protein